MKYMKSIILSIVIFTMMGCNKKDTIMNGLHGTVKVDGSSTVFPITEAVAEEFGKMYPRVRITVGVSGTGGGFKKYTLGEIDINLSLIHI